MADYLGYERAFKRAGILYTVEPGAYERGHGDLTDMRFVVCHHTAGGKDDSDIRIVRDGRPDLDGPLAQVVLKRNGQPHLVAVGVCWQAYGTIPFRGVAPKEGNYHSIGIEGVSNGANDWTPEQRAAYPKVVAAILYDAGLPPDAWIFHREYQPGEKPDPVGFEHVPFGKAVTEFFTTLVNRDKGVIMGWTSAVNGQQFNDNDFNRFVDYHLWRIDKLVTSIARAQKLSTSDDDLKKV